MTEWQRFWAVMGLVAAVPLGSLIVRPPAPLDPDCSGEGGGGPEAALPAEGLVVLPSDGASVVDVGVVLAASVVAAAGGPLRNGLPAVGAVRPSVLLADDLGGVAVHRPASF